MNKISFAVPDKKTINVMELCEYLGVGRNTARRIGIESGAVRRIGRRVLYDRKAIDAYIDAQGRTQE